MNKKHFYSHVISLDPVIVELQTIMLSEKEKTELLTIISLHLHNTILDVVLSRLITEDKKTFLQYIERNDHDITWKFLHEKVPYIEKNIVQSGEKLLKEFLEDIHEVKKRAIVSNQTFLPYYSSSLSSHNRKDLLDTEHLFNIYYSQRTSVRSL